ncbi:MAG TPA: dienelactone hydrolase family protein [Gemmatimonas aurantiaca]|uniref:Dienelactone hydrolase family protein n=2 Tax=Gemmatimonas aurantiaca TaxID=173480 RepID=A0A3D4V8A0_9BACT|nr:dienelactone hydrolase family protein [Gemmatimonas aurantiaca]HCT57054.1 dienelactone hydrolase family protein [Gemmatimonas aurantiaca]
MRSLRTLTATLALVAAPIGAAESQQQPQQQSQPDYAAAMHKEHAHEVPTASLGAGIAPRMAVVGDMVQYGTVDGAAVRGYLAKPKSAAKTGPAIVMVHEWWGINDNIKAMADRYAGEGYTVLAVDLFGGQVATTSDAAMKLYQAGMANIAKGERNVASAVDYLRKNGASSVGAVGYCFGGHWALRTGLAGGANVNAVVMYYGAPITAAPELSRLKAPVLGLFGGKDTGIPVDSVRAMEAQMKRAGRSVTIQVYPNAGHAFANPTGQAYDKATADDAWSRTLGFFKTNLK